MKWNETICATTWCVSMIIQNLLEAGSSFLAHCWITLSSKVEFIFSNFEHWIFHQMMFSLQYHLIFIHISMNIDFISKGCQKMVRKWTFKFFLKVPLCKIHSFLWFFIEKCVPSLLTMSGFEYSVLFPVLFWRSICLPMSCQVPATLNVFTHVSLSPPVVLYISLCPLFFQC